MGVAGHHPRNDCTPYNEALRISSYHSQGCAQEVISGGKFPRGIKRRGQPCACVRRTYLAGGWGYGEKAGIITGIIKLLLWSRSTGHYLGIIGRILEEY